MAETVVINFDAKTQAVISAIERVEGRISAMGKAHGVAATHAQTAAKKTTDSLKSIHRVLQYELVSRGIRGLTDAWRGLASHMDSTTPQMRRLSSAWDGMRDTLSGTMQAALESSGVMDRLTTALSSVSANSGSANEGVARLVTGGLSGLVRVSAVVVEGVLAVAAGITAVVDAAMVAYRFAEQHAREGIRQGANEDQRAISDRLAMDAARRNGTAGQALLSMREEGNWGRNEWLASLMEAPLLSDQERADLEARGMALSNAVADIAEINATAGQDALQQAIDNLSNDAEGYGTLMANLWTAQNDLVDALANGGLSSSGGRGHGASARSETPKTWLEGLAENVNLNNIHLQVGMANTEILISQLRAAGKRALDALNENGELRERYGGGLANLGRLGGGGFTRGAAGTERVTQADIIAGAFSQLPGDAASALGDVASSVGSFIAGTEGAFKSMGEALKSTLASSLGGIGNALMQGAIQAGIAESLALGPVGILIGLGMALMTASGLLGGSGGGATANPAQMRAQADVFSAIRPEGGTRGATTVYHTSIGSYFGDPEKSDSAARGVVGGMRRARRMGELPR